MSVAQNKAVATTPWASSQAYILAVVCLVVGVALGYLFLGSAESAEPHALADSWLQ